MQSAISYVDGLEVFDEELALSQLLASGCLIMLPTDDGNNFSLFVNCNEVFAPAADWEHIAPDQLRELYRMWESDPDFGTDAWCVFVRKQKPLDHICKLMTRWNITGLIEAVELYHEYRPGLPDSDVSQWSRCSIFSTTHR